MKHWLLFILVISWFCFPLSGQQTNRPDWVKQHPVSGLSYIGIGMAEISEGDYQQKAKQNALSDLVSEIQVVIAANSLLNTLEDDGNVKQTFAESIRTEARAEIENFRLVDSWRSDNEYWVYYELNKDDYAALVEARRQKAIRNGFDFWYKGHITLQQGDLMTAIQLFSNGMEAIRSVLNQELFCSYEGKTINLATELYAALAGVFDGITIVLNPATVSATPFQGIREPIAIGVYRNGNPLRNIRLKAEFVSGSGDLSSMSPTDESGVAALYVRNITSKQAQQEIGISLIDDVFSLFRKGSYAALFKQMLSSLPGATLTVNTAQTQTSAYVRSAQSDIETVERTVKSLLNNHFFNVVASPSEADIIVTLDNKCRKGNTVPGELYNFIEFFSTLGIKIENNRTGQILLNYSINDERTLVPENKSASQGKNMAARELIKRLNREFARELKKITFDRTGKIPERQKMLPDVPVPVVGASVPEKEADPVISVPVVVPEVIPAPLVPVKSAKPENQKAIRVEWLDGVFVEFDKLATLGDKSRIHLKIVNTNVDDCEVDLYNVRNITSKQAQQEIGISLIDDVFSLFRKGSYAALFKQMLSSLPGATLTVNTAQTQTSAYVRSAQSDIETVERTVKSLLNNHFFNVVASPSEADIIVTLDNKCRKGNTVPGELYNFIEFFSTLGIKIENNRTGQILLNYSINDERTLVPENKSASQGKNMAARELIKRLNREFARELKKITFDRTGKIPERQKMLPDVPVPVVGASVPEKEADPVISVPVVVPEVIPAPLVPVKSAKPENQKAIRVEWLDGVFVEFDKLATLGDKSRIHLKIVNTNADDCEVDLYSGNLTVINEKGEESPIVSLKLGSKFNDRRVTALIVPDLPTEMVIEVSKLQSVALLQLKDFKNNIVKLRGLK